MAIIIILIVLGLSAICFPASLSFESQESSTVFIDGNTFYVGGSNPGNFSNIQDAINNATSGDRVFVYQGIYYEHVKIQKSISLIGENKNHTIIDGNNTGDVISFHADDIYISGFTIKNGGNIPMVDAGIEIHSDYNIIASNRVCYNGEFGVGIFLNESSHNYVNNNHIYGNGNEGIYLEGATNNLIWDNDIFRNGHCSVVVSNSSYNMIFYNDMYENHDAGVSLWPDSMYNEIAWNAIRDMPYSAVGIWWGADNNTVHNNYFYNNPLYGVKIISANQNVIKCNTISGSDKGILLTGSNFTVIQQNNFIENRCDAVFENSVHTWWIVNYWDEWRGFGPKFITGNISLPWGNSRIIPWVNFDWFPAQEPYLI